MFQRNERETIKSLWLLQPLHIPNQRWEKISIDFITNLPKSKGKDAFLWLWFDSQNIHIFVEFKVHIQKIN